MSKMLDKPKGSERERRLRGQLDHRLTFARTPG
jgi:hypothetical protein